MTSEQIERFLELKNPSFEEAIKIDFKSRNSIRGLLVKHNDYTELKSKNFWRVVVKDNLKKWKESRNVEYAKIFNGTDFTKLSVINLKEEE
jgi:hypothetical protein